MYIYISVYRSILIYIYTRVNKHTVLHTNIHIYIYTPTHLYNWYNYIYIYSYIYTFIWYMYLDVCFLFFFLAQAQPKRFAVLNFCLLLRRLFFSMHWIHLFWWDWQTTGYVAVCVAMCCNLVQVVAVCASTLMCNTVCSKDTYIYIYEYAYTTIYCNRIYFEGQELGQLSRSPV